MYPVWLVLLAAGFVARSSQIAAVLNLGIAHFEQDFLCGGASRLRSFFRGLFPPARSAGIWRGGDWLPWLERRPSLPWFWLRLRRAKDMLLARALPARKIPRRLRERIYETKY